MAISANTTYEILPIEDITLAIEVAGNSVANKANARLWTRNDSNAQKWLFTAEGTADVWYIKDAETGKCMEVYGGLANDKNGGNVSMYTSNNSVAQKWLAAYIGTQDVNGTAYETYQFIAFGGTTSTPRCMDVQGSGSYIRSNIQIHGRSVGHPSQTFVLVPTEWNAIGGTGNTQTVLPVPTRGHANGTVGSEPSPNPFAASSGTVYPAFECPNEYYQLRYRTCTRSVGETALSAWSDWRSIEDGSTGFGGWGSVGDYNCHPTVIDGVNWSELGVSVDNSDAYDLTDVQFSARAWVPDWGEGSTVSAHGGAATWTATTVRDIERLDVTATMTPDGLLVGWATDWTRGGNSVVAQSNIFTAANAVGDASGQLLVPITALSRIPDDGDTIDMAISFTTSDGFEKVSDGTVQVSYATGHSGDLVLSSSVSGTFATVAASNASATAWLVVPRGHGNRFVKLEGSSPWKIAPPLNVPWTVYSAVETSGGWVSTAETFDPIADKNYHVTSQALDRDLAIIGGVNSPQTFKPSYSRSIESAETYNRERSVNVLGRVTDASWTFKGAALPDTFDTCDWALHAGHAYFRAPNGFWAQVAITGGSMDFTFKEYSTFEISCIEEVW